MKTLIVIALVLLVGCASIKYGDFSYSRFGNQELIDVEIKTVNADGSKVTASLGKQKSEREMAEMLKTILEILREMEGRK
jgi:hypothetical protein